MHSIFDNMALHDRHALVCGASAGIGRAAALALARMGATITVLARREARLQDLASELLGAGSPRAEILVADMDDRESLLPKVQGLLSRSVVHILINNSGGPPPGRLLDAAEEDFLAAFGRHVLSAHLLVKAVLPGMKKAGWGRIINIISLSVREPIPNLGVSNTVRGAMASWAKSMAAEFPPGVTINNVLPGYTDTERLRTLKESIAAGRGVSAGLVESEWVSSIPEGRLGNPEELGSVIAFLASPAASYVRGASIPVDGGRLRCI